MPESAACGALSECRPSAIFAATGVFIRKLAVMLEVERSGLNSGQHFLDRAVLGFQFVDGFGGVHGMNTSSVTRNGKGIL